MKKYIYGICFLFCTVVLSQNLKSQKVKEKLRSFPNTQKVYRVLVTNKIVKHGKYKEFYKKKLVVSGVYKEGIKHGSWLYKDPSGTYLQKGRFENGKEVGLWKHKFTEGSSRLFYSKKGVLDSAFYYDKNKNLVESYFSESDKQNTASDSIVFNSSNIDFYKIQKTSCLMEDYENDNLEFNKNEFSSAISKHVKENINIDKVVESLMNSDVAYKVIALFKINAYGEVSNINVKALYPRMEEECKLALQKMPTFVPAFKNKKRVNTLLALPLNFKVQKGEDN